MILLAVLCIAFNLSAATIDIICTNATVSTETLTSGDTKVSFAGLAEVAGQSKTVNLMVWNGNITTSATYASPDVYGAIGVVDVEGAGTIDVRADAITLTATLVGTDGNTYNVSMIHNNVETIVLTDMSITPGEEGSGYTYQLLAMGQAPIMGIAISLATATDYNGTFNVADLFADNSFIMFTNGNMVSFVNGSITISTAAGVTTLQANVLGSDGVQYAITMTSPILANTLDLLSTTLETAEDDGKLYMLGAAEDWSWALDLTIDGYAGYGEYTTVSGIYMDENAEWEITGSGTYSYDETLQSNKFVGILTTADNSLIINATLYYAEKDVEAIAVLIENATYTLTTNDVLYIDCSWSNGSDNHELRFELMEGLQYEKTYLEVQLILDGGPMQGGSFAQSTNAIITKAGEIATLKGRFESAWDGTVYDVTISGQAPDADVETATENILLETTASKYIQDGQLIIIKNAVKYHVLGANVK